MKKIFIFLCLFILLIPSIVFANDKVDVYLFYGETCPHCANEKKMFAEYMKENDDINLHLYEVYYSRENQKLMQKMADDLGINVSGVPFTIIGDKHFIGYSESYTKDKIIKTIKEEKIAIKDGKKDNNQNDETNENIINLPIIGELDTNNLSLPVITIIFGIIDGFNPCAMWVLLFLISILIGMENKRRRIILGSTFILTSTIMYFLFMVAWLNFALFIGATLWIKILVGLVGIGGGIYSLTNGIKRQDDGCEIVDDKKRNNMFTKIKEATAKKSFLLAMIGIIALAISVNFIELLCSAGLPVIYTQILALNNVSTIDYYLFIMLYMLFFMLDDLIVFIIAMTTLKMTGISTKYSKMTKIIGGILMLIIGLLLIFKPELLTFS